MIQNSGNLKSPPSYPTGNASDLQIHNHFDLSKIIKNTEIPRQKIGIKKNHTPGTISIQFKTLTTFSVYEFKIETHTLAYYLYFCMSY